ncbi:MAG: RagB/SusD family nutrient uptake outer membrane protein, partial [Bacteroidetes bacterium]|nr:RagB/SusD family nutrient uptake outer membrane protein [Bacteroidota bacterium]
MKKTFFQPYIVAVALVFLSTLAGSCKKLIAIPPSPPSQIAESQQFGDSSTTMTAISYAYSYVAMSVAGFGYSDAKIPEATGLSSDELLYNNGGDLDMTGFYGYALTNLNSDVSTLWTSPYTSLYNVNSVIAGVSNNPALSGTFRAQATGEMQVMRALYYFNLVNLFGGVPIVLTPDYKVNAVLPRASADSVYDRILADLTSAKQNLTMAYPSSGHIRPNQLVAMALLARVYLYRQQWQQAYDAASAVISSGQYSLVTDPNKVFLDGSTEAIWQLPAKTAYYEVAEAHDFSSQYGAAPFYPVTRYLLNAFEPGDLRMKDWLGQFVLNGDTLYYPYKYKNAQSNSPTTEDVMILRLAEQYLIRAEASAELGNGAAALADLNIVRARAGLPPSTANAGSQSAVLNAIMHERQVELFTEWGHRWYDLKRTGLAATVLSAEKTGWTTDAALYPIPMAQLQSNIYLKQ